MSDLVQFTKQDGIAVITINNPPVNALSPGVPEGILEAIEKIDQDNSVHAAVFIGGGRTFVAGADINEFGKVTSGKKPRGAGMLPMLLSIEDCRKPVRCCDSWHGIWRRSGIGHGRTLPRGGGERAGGPAGSKTRHHPRGGRNADGFRVWPAWPQQWKCAREASQFRPSKLCITESSTG